MSEVGGRVRLDLLSCHSFTIILRQLQTFLKSDIELLLHVAPSFFTLLVKGQTISRDK